jgi:predicted ATPase
LTAAVVPLWMQLSLMDECRRRVEQALAAIAAGSDCGLRREMTLWSALATSLTYAGGVLSELDRAWTKTLDLAERLDDAEYRLRAVWELWTLNRVTRWRLAALTEAKRYCALATSRGDANHRLIGERILGISHHYLGDQVTARRHLEGVRDGYVEAANRSHIVRFQVDLRVSALTFLAPTLWLLGFPDQAMRVAEAAIDDAQRVNHALSVCHALVFGACPTALLVGDFASAEHYASKLIDHSIKHGLARWHAYGNGYRGALLTRCGAITAGLQLLRAGFDELGGFATLRFMDVVLPEALYRAGEITDGLAAADEAIARSEVTGEHRLTSELLRIKGELVLLQAVQGAAVIAEGYFRQALGVARQQGALSWELRAATSLARLLHEEDRSSDAAALLQPVYGRFTEGFETSDLQYAKVLLDALR